MTSVSFLGKELPVYSLLGLAGLAAGLIYLALLCRSRKKAFDDCIYLLLWAVLFGLIGAKLLFLLVHMQEIAEALAAHPGQTGAVLAAYLTGGFVFYGGLFGAILGFYLGCRYFSLPFREYAGLCVPVLPLMHAFGRIGCHLVGCCYGIPYQGPLAVIYTASPDAPNGVPLFPVQLCECLLELALFLLFVLLLSRGKRTDGFLRLYLLLYSVGRFLLEFLRGDTGRGILWGLSTSQWIGILIWLFLLFSALKKKKASGEPAPL